MYNTAPSLSNDFFYKGKSYRDRYQGFVSSAQNESTTGELYNM